MFDPSDVSGYPKGNYKTGTNYQLLMLRNDRAAVQQDYES